MSQRDTVACRWIRLLVLIKSCVVCVSSTAAENTTAIPGDDREAAAASDAAPAWASLIGSAERNKYHRLACGVAKNIKPENRIWFVDSNDATESGYVAAGCNDSKCRPPQPDSKVALGPLGGAGLPPPSLNPPEIPPYPAPAAAAKGKPATGSAKKQVPRLPVPPPRTAAAKAAAANFSWTNVSHDRELEARRKWSVWADWTLDRWCERWHISSAGKVNSNTAYTPAMEQQLMAKFQEMKAQIEENKKRIKELSAPTSEKKART